MHRAPCALHPVARLLQRALRHTRRVFRAPQRVFWQMAKAEWQTHRVPRIAHRVLCIAPFVRSGMHSAARFPRHVFRTTSKALRRMCPAPRRVHRVFRALAGATYQMPDAFWQMASVLCGAWGVFRSPHRVICLTRHARPTTDAQVSLWRFTIIAKGCTSCRTTISW